VAQALSGGRSSAGVPSCHAVADSDRRDPDKQGSGYPHGLVLRKVAARTVDGPTLSPAPAAITAQEVRASFRHAGYARPQLAGGAP
jgi:hypothetical protein